VSEPGGEEERPARYWWLLGLGAVAAWLAMLWFMFADVL
jgi:hypothetical protein